MVKRKNISKKITYKEKGKFKVVTNFTQIKELIKQCGENANNHGWKKTKKEEKIMVG